jgi:hypothetical protein
MPEVKFKVVGSELTSYFDRIQQKGNALTNTFIENAKREAASAKEQVQVIERQISLYEKRNRSAEFIAKLVAKSNYQERVSNVENRGNTIDLLYDNTKENFKKGRISKSEYEDRMARIESLAERNTPGGITSEYKDFLRRDRERFVEDKIRTRLARENIEAVKQGAKDNVSAVKIGDEKIGDIVSKARTPEELLAAQLAKERLTSERFPGKGGSLFPGLTGTLLNIDNLNGLIKNFNQFSQTQNGFDLIQPTGNAAGRIVGGIIGAIIGSFIEPGLGTVVGAGLGGDIAGSIGGGVGEFTQRRALAMQDYLATRNRYIATTGANREFTVSEMNDVGLASKDYINLMRETARASAYSQNAEKYAQDTYYAEKGYGVDKSTSFGLIDLQRSAKDQNRDLANLIGSILKEGGLTYFKNGDTTFLNEFLQKFTQVQRELLKTQNTVATGTTFDILQKFDSIGGQFLTRDPRSLGLIQTINQALINPSSDNLKAASFLSLRRGNPNLDYFSLLKEQQKGLGSPMYLKSMLEFVDNLGGDANQKKLNIARAFGLQNNLAAAETIFNNENKLKRATSQEDIDRLFPSSLKEKTRDNTTILEQTTAQVSDGLLKGWYQTLDAMQDSFGKALDQVVNGIVVKSKDGRLYLDYSPVKANTTKSPEVQKLQQRNGLNRDNTLNMSNPLNRM